MKQLLTILSITGVSLGACDLRADMDTVRVTKASQEQAHIDRFLVRIERVPDSFAWVSVTIPKRHRAGMELARLSFGEGDREDLWVNMYLPPDIIRDVVSDKDAVVEYNEEEPGETANYQQAGGLGTYCAVVVARTDKPVAFKRIVTTKPSDAGAVMRTSDDPVACREVESKPDRDAATVLSRIRTVIEADPTIAKLSDILDTPDMDIGSGIHIFGYRLSDGSGITVGTPDQNKVMYIEHAGKRLFPVVSPAPPQPAAPTRPARELNDPGPAGRDQSIAWSMAATFMAAQCFANTYAKAGGSVSPVAGHPGSYDVSFNALDPAKSNDVAIVRVDITRPDKPVSIWLGERPHRAAVGFPADAQTDRAMPLPKAPTAGADASNGLKMLLASADSFTRAASGVARFEVTCTITK
ncbi:MAG: hypothetical protein NTW21_43240 [Verrucomicrobia bacterium]|nr:hypothetical protein [Verrucomicrobiota bacterium]